MGEGGAAGSIRTGGSQGTSSQGGAGIIGANIAVINNGTITGGIGGTGGLNAGVQNDAVTFQSGINSLTLTTKSVINGVVSANGNDDTLTLQNTLSKIDGGQSDGANISATQYKGFEHLVVNGGRWTVSGSAIVSGETTLNGGALVVTGPAALGVQAITAQGGAIEASGDQVLDQSFVLKNNPYGASTSGLVVQGADNLVLSGVLSDVGRLTKNGSGTLTLTADNTYTGGTVFAGGVVSVDKEVRLGGGDLTFNGGTLQVTGTGWTSTSRAVSLQAGGGTFDIEDAANNFAVTQGVAGAGGLTKSGSGTLTLSGANSYTGATTVSAGTLVVANDNTGGGTTTVDVGAGLQIGTGGVSGSLAGDIVNNGTLVVDRSNAFDLANVISGTGSLTKNGAGTLTLSGVNSYTGGTTVSAGTLAVRADNNLGDASGGLAINGGATLQLTDNLTTARGVTLGAGTATITIDGGKTAQFSNKLTGSGTLAVSGSGTLILSAANDYSGNTTIASGSTLQLGDGSTDGRLAGNVANAGTLTFHNKGGTTFAGEISGTGSLVQNGAGALTLSGDSQGFAGTTTVSSGSLLVSGKLGGTVTVNSGATLDGSGEIGGNTTVNGTLEGASGNGLTFKGDLKLGSGSIINASFDHPGGARIFDVTGDIALDGTVNVSSFGTGGPGLYHLFHYAGTSSGSGLTLGSLPGGVSVDKVYINQQVNDIYVVNTTGATLNYWNGTQSRPQGDGLLHGGNGTWTAATGNFNWTNSPSYDLNGAWDNGAFAVFGGGKGLVTVDTSAGAISASGMQFITTGYKLSGDKLTLVPTTSNPSAKPLIRVGSGSPGDSALIAIISTELTGTHGLEKADGGTLILTGANTYTGGTAISGGTLQLGDGATNGSVQGAISTGADAAHKGVLAIRAAAGTPATIGNTISGTGSVSVLGGTVTFSVANSYTGGTTLAGGTTIVTADANLGAVGTNVALNNGATLRFGANLDATHSFTHAFQLGTVASDVGTLDTDGHDVAMSGVISGAGGLMKSGTGTVTLSGANSYTGGTKVSAGTLVVANDNTGGGTTTVDAGAGLQIGTGGTSGSLAGDIANNGALVVNRSDALNLAGAISGTGSLTKNGAGTLTLSGANSYTGGTKVSAGTLVVANDNTGGGTMTVDVGALLQIGTGGTSGSLAGDIANDGTLVVDRSDAIGLSGAISGAGGLTKNGAGTLTLSGANSYTGATTVSAGILTLTGDNTGGGTTTVDARAELHIGTGGASGSLAGNIVNDGALVVDRSGVIGLSGVISGTGGLTFNGGTLQVMGTSWTSTNRAVSLQAGGGTFDIEDAANNFAVTQGVAGAGGLTKSGSGTLTLSGANSYTGATTVSASTLVVANDNTGGGTTTVDVGAGLQIGTGGVSGSLAGDIVNNGTLVVDRSNAFDLANVISGTGSLTKNGAGTLTLSGANSYTGGTTVSAGTLVVTNDNTGGGTTTVDVGAGLQIGTGGVSGSLAGDIVNNGTLVVDRSNAFDLANVISGTGSLTKNGAGTLTLSGVNSYTGGTTVSAGILVVASDNTGGGTTTVDVGAGLQIGTGGVSGSLAGDIVNNGTLVVDRSNAFDLAKGVAGAGSLTKNGAGTLTLSGVNSYTGGTTVSAGILTLTGDNTGGGTTTVDARAELHIGTGGASGSLAGNIVNDGALVVDRSGVIGLSGVISGTGGLTFNGGTLQVTGTGWTSTSRAVSLQAGGGTFDIEDAANNFAVTQGVAGAGGLTKSGSGTLTLSGANSYTGATTVSASTLVVANDNTGGGTTTVDVGAGLQIGTGGVSGSLAGDIVNNGTLVVDRSNAFDLANVISGTGSLTKNGAGTLTLSGVNSYTGGTTVSAGILTLTGDNTGGGTTTVDAGAVLQIGTGGTSGNLAGGIANNGALVVNRSDALNLANAISGAGSLMKSGAGTLTLSGANSYTGATTVSAGTLTQGAAGGFSTASSRYDVDTDGTLDLGGFDTMLAALYNAGTINMNVGAAGSTLMVNGDYVGHDGTIVFNTVLGDDNSKTDKLMVGGDTAGNTNVQVVNRDGLGAQTVKGIEIITVGGQSNGVFSLVSDYRTKDGQKAVVGGAYAYTLHQGPARGANDGDWYLISQLEDIKPDNPATRRVSDTPDAPDTPAPRYSANVPVYEGYVQTMQALNKPSTLQERVGKRYMTGENGDGRTSGGMVDAHGIWARIQGAHDRLEPTTLTGMKQEINTFILQAGVDGQFYEDENGKLIAGITGQYGTARSNIVARDGDGRISTNAWSLGATATWIGNDGFYVDTQGQVTWFESDLNSDTADVGLASGRKATGYALSVETGKRIALNGNWVLTPQAQLIWSSINADDFEDVWQANISVARGNSFAARFGLAASYDSSWQGSDGRVVNTSVYGITNLYQEFLGGTRVNISGVDFSTDNDRTWAGIGAGGTYAWAGGKYLIFGQGTINTSLDHFADSYAIKGDVGFKVKW
ncbi:autotransporter-associated beta strand repeat-containing protein [Brucella abortus]|uniref:autotransporter-associated beta strand repeat-containing protein n=25 Tax=Brucella/Ochrobactrum group TaxID=2826938 RepID=UPI001FFD98F9|nr:autotransporter-associated beta strand repeat-containing protein [Brucella abortus]